jgi:Mn2+/Fe2+ NRAMP family transporter
VAFGAACILAQMYLEYARYVSVLKWLTLVLFAYFGVLAVAHVDWRTLVADLAIPHIQWNAGYLTGVVAVFGTTISPYLFFWQASQEVEDIDEYPRRDALTQAPLQGKAALARIELDTVVGMALSNLVSLAILVTAAATLNAHQVTNIDSAARAAEALKPIAGSYASLVFALGIIGTGLLAVPVLAGSAAYATGEAFEWETGLSRKPREAKAFYGTLAAATAIGVGLNFTPVDPIKALYWSAVINGVVAVPVMVIMLMMAGREEIMGRFTMPLAMKVGGWAATIVMAIASAGMIVSMI